MVWELRCMGVAISEIGGVGELLLFNYFVKAWSAF